MQQEQSAWLHFYYSVVKTVSKITELVQRDADICVFLCQSSRSQLRIQCVDLSRILSAVSPKLHVWSSHVMWLFIFQKDDPSRQAHSHI